MQNARFCGASGATRLNSIWKDIQQENFANANLPRVNFLKIFQGLV